MNRSASKPIAIAFALAVAALITAHASADTPDEASPLVVMADFNRDGITDIAEATSPSGDSSGPGTLTVMLGQKDGTYLPTGLNLALGHSPQTIAVGDFNGDGNPDVIVGDADGSLLVLLGDGKGNLNPAPNGIHVTSVASIAVGDFNRDGVLDLVVSDPHSNTATVLLGTGDGTFHSSWSFTLPMPGAIFKLAVADFNGDGIPDLAVTSEDQETFDVLLGNGNGTFTRAPDLSHLQDPNAHCVT